ncbi:unnamed protein product [Onchocerca flexuosa]|uniref:PID domain-containing protein n=1 Tax=Onchocerca flexuosa TaxID=387005 RepID=A0A183I3L8_9BILA|nr:unnamed protein product [Onchocerca flexuosa]
MPKFPDVRRTYGAFGKDQDMSQLFKTGTYLHWKSPHNMVLCCIKYGLLTVEQKEQQLNVIITNPMTQERDSDDKEVLLLYNEVKVSKPNMQKQPKRL